MKQELFDIKKRIALNTPYCLDEVMHAGIDIGFILGSRYRISIRFEGKKWVGIGNTKDEALDSAINAILNYKLSK